MEPISISKRNRPVKTYHKAIRIGFLSERKLCLFYHINFFFMIGQIFSTILPHHFGPVRV